MALRKIIIGVLALSLIAGAGFTSTAQAAKKKAVKEVSSSKLKDAQSILSEKKQESKINVEKRQTNGPDKFEGKQKNSVLENLKKAPAFGSDKKQSAQNLSGEKQSALQAPKVKQDALSVSDEKQSALVVPKVKQNALVAPEEKQNALSAPDEKVNSLSAPEVKQNGGYFKYDESAK